MRAARIPDARTLLKALEDAFLFIRGDAPAGVDDLEGQRAPALGGLRFRPGDAQGHGTLFRKFHRVAEQVAERLAQPETVAYEPVGDGAVRHERKPDVPAGAGRAQHGDAGVELGAQGERRAAGGLPVGLKQGIAHDAVHDRKQAAGGLPKVGKQIAVARILRFAFQ